MTRLAFGGPELPTHFDGFHVDLNAESSRADIVFDRPPFNTMSLAQHEQLQIVIEALDIDPAIHVIVLRGLGEHFSYGFERSDPNHGSALDSSRLAFALGAPSRCSKPVIAANRGYCFGSAFELSLACDFRIVTETTLYALPTHKAGQVLCFDSVARLHGMIGTGRTRDMVMRPRIIQGIKAYDWGIATEFAVDNELENVTEAVVRDLLASSPLDPRTSKKLLNDVEDTPLRADLKLTRKSWEPISA
ncbi:2-oxoglutaroyl-CoA hydrolase [Paraburkholderia sp. GAS199]|uniref:enoyl-CoA hydratase/isomerase family protein n=1 Tax=Paraburkholderia sp. GAS199 TaxID=3035126 RepID=UPI003D1E2AC4